jgi:hypothetical protein
VQTLLRRRPRLACWGDGLVRCDAAEVLGGSHPNGPVWSAWWALALPWWFASDRGKPGLETVLREETTPRPLTRRTMLGGGGG